VRQRRGMIGGPARRQRLHTVKPQIGQIERLDENIDRANRIAPMRPRRASPNGSLRGIWRICYFPIRTNWIFALRGWEFSAVRLRGRSVRGRSSPSGCGTSAW
jgi:hypothetical protein